MDLIYLIVGLALVGLFVRLIIQFLNPAEPFRTAIYVITGLAVLLYLLKRFGSFLPNLLP